MDILRVNSIPKNITITEIANLWSLLDNALISLSQVEVLHNQTSNDDLKKILKKIRDESTLKIINKVKKILEDANVTEPPNYSRRDMQDLNYQKNDAMLTDAEIASTVLQSLSSALIFFTGGITQTTNKTLSLIYLSFFVDIAKLSSDLLELSQKGGWINVPPTLQNIKQ